MFGRAESRNVALRFPCFPLGLLGAGQRSAMDLQGRSDLMPVLRKPAKVQQWAVVATNIDTLHEL